jgi:hypothetical protein
MYFPQHRGNKPLQHNDGVALKVIYLSIDATAYISLKSTAPYEESGLSRKVKTSLPSSSD